MSKPGHRARSVSLLNCCASPLSHPVLRTTVEMSSSPPVLQRRELGSEEFPNVPKVTRQGSHKVNSRSSDGGSQGPGGSELLKITQRVSSRAELDSSICFSPKHQGRTGFSPSKEIKLGKNPRPWHTDFLLLALPHVVDEHVLFWHQQKQSPENVIFLGHSLHSYFSMT